MPDNKMINLHSHTEASIADGLFSPKKWVEALKDKGFKAHAITDHGTMASVLPFYKLARKEGITPIIGCEFYYIDDPTIHDAEHRKASHLILLAKNYEGFQNLLRLSKLSYTEGYYYRARIGLEWLKKYSENLVCLTACQGGVLSNEVWREVNDEKTMGLIPRFKQFREIFGKDFYVEFQGHYTGSVDKESGKLFNSQELINRSLYELKDQKGFQPIITNDCHYILQEHAQIQKVIKDISYGKADSATSGTVTEDHFTDSLWLKTDRQVFKAFREHHEYMPLPFLKTGFENIHEVFEKCKDFELPEDKRYLPKYRAGKDSTKMFKSLVFKKFREFVVDTPRLRASVMEYKERLKKEMAVITKYGLEDYFLIVWDLIAYAEKNDIYSGLGRGSAAGCLVSYMLGIVKIDPLEHGLIFERFLNENRCESGELPDIDLDFESKHREQIKEYIYQTYGADHVCEIGTYGRMMLKTALIDFAKATTSITHREILDITTKLELDKEEVHDLDAAMEFDSRLKTLIDDNPKLGFMVREIEGQVKSQGLHPAGLIICSEPVGEVTPLKSLKDNKDKKSTERILVTQSEDKHIIAQGLMKVDVLGLKEYDVIKYVIKNALPKKGLPTLTRENYVDVIMGAERKSPNVAVWDMFQNGKTEGVFQFASDGMKELLVNMKPEEIKDLIAANALYRPGCLKNGWHLDYCNRKSGLETVKYVHKDVEKALSETYGIIVYQEQFMEVIHRLGKVSLVDSDIIRSALGKKDKDKLAKFKDTFVKGATGRISKDKAVELWDQIEKASGYSFNKSHSAAYSVLAYISQYLKVNYPALFWAGQLHWDVAKNKAEDMITDRRAAQDMGVKYRLPDINKSKGHFRVNKKSEIVWCISAVKGVGPKAADEILKHQPYKSFEDFYTRVNKSVLKYNVIEALIFGGVFDSIEDRRECLRQLTEFRRAKSKKVAAYVSPTEEQLMMKFKDSLGFFERKIKDLKGTFSAEVITEKELREMSDGDECVIGGVITEVRVIKTKNKEPMAFATIMDLDEMIDVTIFPRDFPTFRKYLREDKIVEIVGKKNVYKERQNGIIANSFTER